MSNKPQINLEEHNGGWRVRPSSDPNALKDFLRRINASEVRETSRGVCFEEHHPTRSSRQRARQDRIDGMNVVIYGNLEDEDALPVQLREVSFRGSPDVLRAIGMFLIESAADLEHEDNPNWHTHWRCSDAIDHPNVVVVSDLEHED